MEIYLIFCENISQISHISLDPSARDYRIIWHQGQFGTEMSKRTIWHCNEKKTIWHLGQFGTAMKRGQFGTNVENKQFGNIIKSDRESQHLQFKYYAAFFSVCLLGAGLRNVYFLKSDI